MPSFSCKIYSLAVYCLVFVIVNFDVLYQKPHFKSQIIMLHIFYITLLMSTVLTGTVATKIVHSVRLVSN